MKLIKIFCAALLLLAVACSKNSKKNPGQPDTSRVVTTLQPTDIGQNSATLGGTVFWEEGKAPSANVYFLIVKNDLLDKGEAQFPTVQQMLDAGATFVDAPSPIYGAETEHIFSAVASGLESRTCYFCCAAAEFGPEVVYGEVRSFWTLQSQIVDLDATEVTATSMTVSFRYDGDDVNNVSLSWSVPGEGLEGVESVYTVDDAHVYTFMLDGLYPNRRYCFKPEIHIAGGYTISDFLYVNTLEGIVLMQVENKSSTSVKVRVMLWPMADVPTIYYTTDPYTIANDYASAPHVSMYRVKVSGMPDNYGPEFTVDLINLTPGTKYYFLVALGDVKMEISSFTTASN